MRGEGPERVYTVRALAHATANRRITLLGESIAPLLRVGAGLRGRARLPATRVRGETTTHEPKVVPALYSAGPGRVVLLHTWETGSLLLVGCRGPARVGKGG